MKEGWLKKLGLYNKSWKLRYFALNKYGQLKYYRDSSRKEFLGLVDCKEIISVTDGKVYENNLRCTFDINTKQRVWTFGAPDKNERVRKQNSL